jgi:energy-coupling factor transporter ATP-binding protein EcfA2
MQFAGAVLQGRTRSLDEAGRDLITELRLENFKAFEKFTMTLGQSAYAVGPNNAGKSTALAALRTGARMLRYASNVKPNIACRDHDISLVGYRFTAAQFGLVDENIRHEGRGLEARMSLRFRGGASLTAIWPAAEPYTYPTPRPYFDDDDEDDLEPDDEVQKSPFFFLERKDLAQPRRPKNVRDSFPSLGVVPSLNPVEPSEQLLKPQTVRDNVEGRLSSRHFRNQLFLLTDDERAAFRTYCEEWAPEIMVGDLMSRVSDDGGMLDLFYREPDRRADKEISWAGDGIQIWIQLLLHVFRLQTRSTILLDEPDLYLHPDLQRRLVRLLETLDAQTITATHSAEVLAEAPADSVVWIDKSRARSVRGPKAATLAQLSAALGTQFNLRLAKALRARVVLFVEGDDMKIIRSIARTAGAANISTETAMAVIPLEGYDNWEHLEPFSWLWDGLLKKTVPVFVILDRDYRSAVASADVVSRLAAIDITAHVWERKELESYLLVPDALARLSGASAEWVQETLDSSAAAMEHSVFARFLAAENKDAEARRKAVPTTERVAEAFAKSWNQEAWRLRHCPPKDLIKKLNSELDAAGHKPVNARRLAAELRRDEIDPEVVNVLMAVETAVR